MASLTDISTLDVLVNEVLSSPTKYLTVLAPMIPGVGHIINLLISKVDFYPYLLKDKKHPIVTIPLADNKIYVLTSPRLIQAAMRSKSLSSEPFLLEHSQDLLGMTDDEFALVQKSVPDLIRAVHGSMVSEHLHAMNATVLKYIADEINAIGSFSLPSLDVNNTWIWIRNLTTMATTKAMFGHRNPFHFNPLLVDDLCPRSVTARARLQAALQKYYAARLDDGPDVSQIMRARAELLPLIEESLTPASASEGSNGMRQATVNVSVLEDRAPFLVSCLRETNRLYNHAVIVRRVIADTQLSSSSDCGTAYLLKKGADVHTPAGVVHRLPEVWGPAADEFQADRFLGGATGTEADDRTRKAAIMPFGGGLHLCPGRDFAFAESLGLMVALVVGYDVRGLGDGPGLVPVPRAVTVGLGHKIAKPVGVGVGLRVSITRRKGWEDVKWRYISL
ncbi:cytochrome P450 [Podospora appendiculata]|uniref:Cytochrome P450 n=1 Tax=Podospora appendiculata TaxID=314037 RepID=A0AAE0X303_9PEZI|nr:cytochrome P450 [Podospora appendiculata]